MPDQDLSAFDHIRIDEAARRLDGVVKRTPLVSLQSPDPRIDLRAKLENRQECGAFKARGAWNNLAQLADSVREKGVVACSSGNHGRALAWAARRAGVPATIVMPKDAYPNKIEACRELGARVVLSEDRLAADVDAAAIEAQGLVFVHPYDLAGTVEGAGTVGLELSEDWPEVELVMIPVGGGGLISGASLALRRRLGPDLKILGVEPAGAPSMKLGLENGSPVLLPSITTQVQGLCPTSSGVLNIAICSQTVDGILLVEDDEVFEAQAELVAAGEIVEPAGAAAFAALRTGKVPAELLEGRDEHDPLRVALVVSGGNPDPAQLEQIRSLA